MTHDYTLKEMSELLYSMLKQIKDDEQNETEVTLVEPTIENNSPCRVISAILEKTTMSENGIPIIKTFQINIEHWCNDAKTCMEMVNNTDKQLEKKNFTKTETSKIIFDKTLNMYKLTTIYEVRYNGLTNSFEIIKNKEENNYVRT